MYRREGKLEKRNANKKGRESKRQAGSGRGKEKEKEVRGEEGGERGGERLNVPSGAKIWSTPVLSKVYVTLSFALSVKSRSPPLRSHASCPSPLPRSVAGFGEALTVRGVAGLPVSGQPLLPRVHAPGCPASPAAPPAPAAPAAAADAGGRRAGKPVSRSAGSRASHAGDSRTRSSTASSSRSSAG